MKAHKEVLTKHKVTLLKMAAEHILISGRNDFPLQALENRTDYNNFQKLRYHGLIHHVKVNGYQKRGHWLITRNGWAFLKGELALPKWVMVQDNQIIQRSFDTLKIQQVYYGSDAIHTSFDYFSEEGLPVGVRPLSPMVRQTVLV